MLFLDGYKDRACLNFQSLYLDPKVFFSSLTAGGERLVRRATLYLFNLGSDERSRSIRVGSAVTRPEPVFPIQIGFRIVPSYSRTFLILEIIVQAFQGDPVRKGMR